MARPTASECSVLERLRSCDCTTRAKWHPSQNFFISFVFQYLRSFWHGAKTLPLASLRHLTHWKCLIPQRLVLRTSSANTRSFAVIPDRESSPRRAVSLHRFGDNREIAGSTALRLLLWRAAVYPVPRAGLRTWPFAIPCGARLSLHRSFAFWREDGRSSG